MAELESTAWRIVRLFAVTIMLLMLLATWPHLFALERFPIIAQLTALRGLLILISVLAPWGLAIWRGVGGSRGAWPLCCLLALSS